ncbi:MAG: SGNH/GDSL hydrolase family protein [Gemmatimonadota bacterium]|nr:SGNH/GDSL hydrolase family protein [Gemmatimonadota bacterium]
MYCNRYLAGGAAALILSTAIVACSDNNNVLGGKPVDPLFKTYVSMGNSITAGFQSGGINDSTQMQSYAVLFAHAVNTGYRVPLLNKPGCPPPVDNFLTQHRVGGGSDVTCALRNPATTPGALNNVAVPGAISLSPTGAVPGPDTLVENVLTTLILGGETQAQRAAEAQPTFVSAWIGNNDVLNASLSGILPATPGISNGVTSIDAFTTNYKNLVKALRAIPSIKGGVLIGVVNTANVPLLFPAAALYNPAVKGAFDAAAGTATVLDPTTCPPTTTSLINFQLAGAIRAGAHPPEIACEALPVPFAPVGNVYVLDATEQAAVTDTVNAYNALISAEADSLGFAYYDPNPSLVALKQSGAVPIFPDLTQPTAAFGIYFSLDGVHPAAAAHVLLANGIIDVVNAKYGTSIPHSP